MHVPGLLGAVSFVMGAPSPSQADTAASDDPAPIINKGFVTVDTYSGDHRRLLSTVTYGPETEGIPIEVPEGGMMPMDSGSGGSSSASGCRTVTVNNESETLLGPTAFWFHTWTDWCWTRSTQNINNVSKGWSITDVDSFYDWQGIVNQELGFYDFSTNDGHPKSAYKHYRQGKFANCAPAIPCRKLLPGEHAAVLPQWHLGLGHRRLMRTP